MEGIKHTIRVIEFDDEWSPFKPFSSSPLSDSEDDDDENGVPDTWDQIIMNLEEGENEEDPNENEEDPEEEEEDHGMDPDDESDEDS